MTIEKWISDHGWVPEWPKGTDCKSAANCFGGSNPPPSIRVRCSDMSRFAICKVCVRHTLAVSLRDAFAGMAE